MVEETVKGTLEGIDIFVPPEIPLDDRIDSILPGWKVFKQTVSYVTIKTEDNKKIVKSLKGKTEIGCVGEHGTNTKNLEDIRKAILKVAQISKKANDVELQLKEVEATDQLIYPKFPNVVGSQELANALNNFINSGRLN